ncbi:cytochrome b/b6 domain-containing protein [Hephaestia sp. GCM10023244]|uniref:cytochrome b/b6 domain-containing protein n=1 Tax=unclassified Hephaestia TaxID=2631281 RepID=UPI00207748FF|nr:cytochrome b/b6 domain-containing protein [Hephaestia sp. MAHUQ-44]MCM8729689.1 cytochrome b/b6 domain-containing protein [Hephaestia sp. MAHUQ-44]
MDGPADATPTLPSPRAIRRHAIPTRLWHWINAVAVFVLIGSGLGISNAHPRLYWGEYGANFDHAWLNLPHWPGWLTIPGHYNLALSRRWHLFFALVLGGGLLIFVMVSLINRHFHHHLRVRRDEMAPRHLWGDAKAHLALRFHDPARPAAYNTLQKLSYIGAIFILLPLLVVSGLALSPGMDAAWPWLTQIFGGRQSARSIHFIAMAAMSGFVIVHLALVILAGPVNAVRSMITGSWRVPEEPL